MCAIAGVIEARPKAELLPYIEQMTRIVSHRGPDGADHRYYEQVAFGHCRLAIIDLTDGGRQPMEYQHLSVTYNGEIYNYLQIKQDLEKLGYKFKTKSDTEVLLAAYDHWNEDCVHHLNGMWAFAIYDSKQCKVFLARDHFGIKPLYLWRSPTGAIAFGSEIKQFTVLPDWKPALNHERVSDFLAFGVCDHTEETMFDGVKQLPGGHCLTIDLKKQPGDLNFRQWYELPNKKFDGTYQEASHQFKELFYDSVRLRLHADVKAGSCLSGGLDSSSIVCVANNILRSQGITDSQETFSACWPSSEVDESRYMHAVTRRTGTSWHPVHPTPNQLFDALDTIIWHQDEPFSSTSIFAQWKVFEAAKTRVKVMLDGQGADEELFGYPSYYSVLLASLIRQLKWGRFARELSAFHRELGMSYRSQLASTANDLLPRSMSRVLKVIAGRENLAEKVLVRRPQSHPLFADGQRNSLSETSRSQLFKTNLPMLLHWEDRNSMAHSIEARVPFLDHRLTEFLVSLPEDFRLAGGINKRVMRDALADDLPPEINSRRDKIGFSTPEKDWFRSEFKQQIVKGCADTIRKHQFMFSSQAEDYVRLSLQPGSSYMGMAWRIFCFGKWIERFKIEALH